MPYSELEMLMESLEIYVTTAGFPSPFFISRILGEQLKTHGLHILLHRLVVCEHRADESDECQALNKKASELRKSFDDARTEMSWLLTERRRIAERLVSTSQEKMVKDKEAKIKERIKKQESIAAEIEAIQSRYPGILQRKTEELRYHLLVPYARGALETHTKLLRDLNMRDVRCNYHSTEQISDELHVHIWTIRNAGGRPYKPANWNRDSGHSYFNAICSTAHKKHFKELVKTGHAGHMYSIENNVRPARPDYHVESTVDIEELGKSSEGLRLLREYGSRAVEEKRAQINKMREKTISEIERPTSASSYEQYGGSAWGNLEMSCLEEGLPGSSNRPAGPSSAPARALGIILAVPSALPASAPVQRLLLESARDDLAVYSGHDEPDESFLEACMDKIKVDK
ncbi:MAG: hypothetical protein M1820_003445 [Bogoriella megaspora]|nr:MAG: hypothetical protein M1820_003445 [Bogoriella megaspora]